VGAGGGRLVWIGWAAFTEDDLLAFFKDLAFSSNLKLPNH
jgi:hypothetical protein